ncbi:MAG: hypothetical protein ABEK59_13020 [Halobacteria archaeon]
MTDFNFLATLGLLKSRAEAQGESILLSVVFRRPTLVERVAKGLLSLNISPFVHRQIYLRRLVGQDSREIPLLWDHSSTGTALYPTPDPHNLSAKARRFYVICPDRLFARVPFQADFKPKAEVTLYELLGDIDLTRALSKKRTLEVLIEQASACLEHWLASFGFGNFEASLKLGRFCYQVRIPPSPDLNIEYQAFASYSEKKVDEVLDPNFSL